ncbi:MAG: Yip1 family protein [Pseudomonadota bacterium]
MIAVDLGRRMVEGLFAPSRAAREILEARLTLQTGVLFVVLSFLLSAMISIVMRLMLLEEPSGPSLGGYVLGLISAFVRVGLFGVAIWWGGRLFGGEGARDQALILVAWHAVVTAPLEILVNLVALELAAVMPNPGDPVDPEAMAEISQIVLLLALYAGFQYLWTLACFTKELHGFSQPWGTMGVMVACTALFGQFLIAISS